MNPSELFDAEAQRVAALHDSGSLDGPENHDFDFVVRAAAKLCDVPQAFVAFIDRDTVWIKATLDYLPFMQLPRASTYGDLALGEEELVNIADLHADPRTAQHPLTRSGHGFRMYAATPVRTPEGKPIGVLSLLDHRARLLDAEQRDWLLQLGQQTSALVEWRRQRRHLEAALLDNERATRLDTLTGLPNRPWLLAKIDEEYDRAQRFGLCMALVLFSLDQLDDINAQLGRDCGDAMLARVGRLLRQSLRNTDTAGRMAGDQFCIILPNTTPEGAATLAETLRGRLERKPNPIEPALALTGSFGVAASEPGHIGGGHALLASATAALELARKSGRNRVALASL
ncbi:diguanylate cyclase domain-containing protein [Chitinimonas sp.]|uniref:GGDEF domain-containing protein n=1 Tax=Chitinimonas sp. TaxID=1934313 RepID=UPI0035ADE1E8